MIDRLETDPEFQKRQKALGFLAIAAKKTGLASFLGLPAFHAVMPYMKIELRL